MKISNKLLFGLTVIALLTAAVGLISYTTNKRVIRSTDYLRENVIAERKAAAIMNSALITLHDSGQSLMLESYRAAIKPNESAAAEQTVSAALSDIAEQLRNFRAQVEANRQINEKAAENAPAPQSPEAERERTQLAVGGEIKREFEIYAELLERNLPLIKTDLERADEFNRENLRPQFETRLLPLIRRYEANSAEKLEIEAGKIENALLRENKVVLFSTLITLLIMVFVGIYLAGSISKPIRRLKQIALEFGEGNFDNRIEFGSADEIGVLGNAFNEMAEQIKSRTEKLKVLNEQLAAELAEQKRTEELLRRREQELSDFLENAAVGLHWTEADGNIVWANKAELDLLGYTRDEYFGHNIAEFHDDKNTIADILRRENNNEILQNYEARLRTKNGSIKHVLINSNVLWEDGKFIHTRCFSRDVTERKAAEEALRDSEAGYRQLADAMPQIVWTARADGYLDYYNQRWFDYTGMTLDETIGWGWEPVLHPDDLQNCLDVWQSAVKTGESYKVEYRFKRGNDGEYRWHLGQALPVRDAENRIVKWFGTCTDIHEQKRVEEKLRTIQEDLESRVKIRTAALERANSVLIEQIAERERTENELRESQRFIESVTENSTSIIYVFDLDTMTNVYSNREVSDFLGYTLKETQAMGRDYISTVTHPDDLAVRNEHLSQFAEMPDSEVMEFEARLKHHTGDWRWIWFRERIFKRRPDGTPQQIMGTAQDITERKHIKQALSEAANRERAMIENALDVICTIDAEGRFISINPACFKIWGYQPEELVGRPFIDFVAPEDVEKTIAKDTSIESGNETTNFENRYLHKNGTLVHVRWTAYWSEDEQLVFCVAHDITDRKRAEEKLKNVADRLARSNAELQDFASVASHDLQEPLRKVQAFGDRLKSKCGDALNEEGLDYLGRMLNAASRMQTLINDLLTFSRVSSKGQPFVTVNLRRVADEVLSDLETRIETTKGTVEIGELATVEADPTQMRQLLQNLIGNALKFNRPGVAPIVKISGRVCRNLSAKKDEKGADSLYCLTVEDNGIGFDDKYNDRIFKIFQRLHGRSEYEGTGVGLAVCRRIAERHGGDIKASSVPNEGTTFTVNLPVKQQVGLSNE